MTEAIIVKDSGTFELPPADTYPAVCFGVWDVGMQKSVYNGHASLKPKVIIGWEIDHRMADGKRFTIFRSYTKGLTDKSTLTKELTSWRGVPFTAEERKGFDLTKLVGANCLLSIIHNEKEGKTYANVQTITKIPKGMPGFAAESGEEIPKYVQIYLDRAGIDGSDIGGTDTDGEDSPPF